MFFKKKSKVLHAVHYEGLPNFQQDAACSIEIGFVGKNFYSLV